MYYVLYRVVQKLLDPQAGAVSRIRRQILVRQKSAEKIRLAEYYYSRKYRYTTTVSVC